VARQNDGGMKNYRPAAQVIPKIIFLTIAIYAKSAFRIYFKSVQQSFIFFTLENNIKYMYLLQKINLKKINVDHSFIHRPRSTVSSGCHAAYHKILLPSEFEGRNVPDFKM
jgi:hypothetical protein